MPTDIIQTQQNLPDTLEIAFFELITLILVVLRLFMLRKLAHKYSKDPDKYGIPVKAAVLHNSDFVNRIRPIKN